MPAGRLRAVSRRVCFRFPGRLGEPRAGSPFLLLKVPPGAPVLRPSKYLLLDAVRRRILELFAAGEHSSGDIVLVVQREFAITQSAVSQQLRVLRESGFASARVDGPRRIYSVEPGPLRDIDDWLNRFRMFWAPRLDALATEIARGKRKRRK